jgi:hypothetical protein
MADEKNVPPRDWPKIFAAISGNVMILAFAGELENRPTKKTTDRRTNDPWFGFYSKFFSEIITSCLLASISRSAIRAFYASDFFGFCKTREWAEKNRPEKSDRERTAAAAGLGGVRILELEAALFEAFVVIDNRTVQVKGALLVDDQFDAVRLDLGVLLFVEVGVEIHHVIEAGATAGPHTHSQKCRSVQLMGLFRLRYFLSSTFSQRDRHSKTSSKPNDF